MKDPEAVYCNQEETPGLWNHRFDGHLYSRGAALVPQASEGVSTSKLKK